MSHEAHADHGHGGRPHVPHVLPYKIYFGVWAALIVLTVVTVGVSYFDFGAGNLVVAMIVATVKGTLVCMYFMHLKYDDRFNTMIVLSAFAFLALLFMFTLADLPRRGEVDAVEYGTIKPLPESSLLPEGDHGEPGSGEDGHGEDAAPEEAEAPEGDAGGH